MKTYLFLFELPIIIYSILQILFFNLSFAQSTDYLYNPLPFLSFNVSQYGKNLIQIQFIKLLPDLMFLSFQDEGLWILDYQNNNEVLAYKKMELSQVQLIDLNIFALTQDKGILSMYFNQNEKEIFIKGTFNPSNYKINTFSVTQDQEYLVFGTDCHIKVMKIVKSAIDGLNKVVDNDFLIEKATEGIDCKSNSMHLFMSSKAIVLSTIRDGMHLFNSQNIQNPKYIRSLVQVSTDVQQTYLMKYQNTLITLSKYYEVKIIRLGDQFDNSNIDFSLIDESSLQNVTLTQSGGSKTYNYMLIDEDEKFLYLGVRTNGIVIYDLANVYRTTLRTPNLVQSLNSNGLAVWISFAPPKLQIRKQYENIFLSDGTFINVFEKVPANLNSNIINLYNSDMCIYDNFTSDNWPWSVVTYGEGNYFIAISSGSAGMFTFDLSLRGQIISMQNIIIHQGQSHDGILYLPNRKVIVLGQSGEGMAFFNATEPDNLVLINEYKLIGDKLQNDCDDITSDTSERFLACANGFQGFYILQVEDFKNPVLWAQSDMTLKKNGVESVIIDDGLNFGFYAIREEGVGCFRIHKNNQGTNVISQVTFFPTLGAEYLRFDISSNQTIVLVADGYQGLTIIDCSDYLNPILSKSIPVQGWAVKFTQLQANPSTIIISQMEKGQISVIDITFLNEGTKISSLQYGSESAFGIASHPKNEFIIFTLAKGMRVCTTINPLKIHTQIQRYGNLQLSNYHPYIPPKSISSQDRLFIGEKVDLIISPYYHPRRIKFDEIFYYSNYQLNTLPPWIQFVQYLQTITIIPNLDAINTNKGFNILLIQVLIPILPTDFVMRSIDPPVLIVDSQQSQRIFNKLIQVGLLEGEGYVTNFFSQNMKLELDWYIDDAEKQMYTQYENDILYAISRILTRASFNYPIQFLVEGSLKFNYNSKNYTIQDGTPLIQSFSSTITVGLIICKNENTNVQFVKQKLDGVIYSYTQNNQIFSMQGDIKIINEYLIQKMIVSDPLQQSPKSLTNILIQVNITDTINNPFIDKKDISHLTFIRNKKLINFTESFQSQYQRQYPKGLTAQEKFLIMIDKSLIQVDTDLTIGIQAQMMSDGQWTNLNQLSDFWMSFEDFQLRGIPPLSAWRSQFEIRIEVSDGYTEKESILEIKIEIFPTKQIMLIIALILPILLLLLALFLCRRKIHLIFFQRYHGFSQEVIFCNEMYQKKIVLAPYIYEQTLKLFNQLYKSFYEQNQEGDDQIQKKIEGFISNYRNSDQTINYEEFFKDAFQIFQSNQSKFPKITESEFKYNDTRVKISLKSYLAKFILNNNSQMLKIYKRLKKYTQKQQDGYYVDWYKKYVEEIGTSYQNSKTQSITTSNQQNSLNESENKVAFGQLDIKVNELQEAIEKILDQNELNLDQDFYILTEAIKADYYGFDYQIKPKFWRSSLGEVVHFKINKTDPIIIYRKVELDGNKNSLINKLKQFFMINFKFIGSYKRNLPEWLGYEQYDNIMLLSGVPKKSHQGEYKVVIYNRNGYASQSINFLIKHKSKKLNGEKSFMQDTPNVRKKMSDNISLYGNNLNGSVQLYNNYSQQTEKLIPLNLPTTTLKTTTNSSFQKINAKIMLNKLSTEENARDQKRSYFAVEAGYVNYLSQEGVDNCQNPQYQRPDESINSVNSNQLKEDINGINQYNINYLALSGKLKQPYIPSLLSPPISVGNRENISMFHSLHNLKGKSKKSK